MTSISTFQVFNLTNVSSFQTTTPIEVTPTPIEPSKLISSFQAIDFTNVSSFQTINGMGMTSMPFEVSNRMPFLSPFYAYSTITTWDISGNTTRYDVDISGARHISTIEGLSTIEATSTAAGIIDAHNLSTQQAISTLANVQVNISDIINSHNLLIHLEEQNKTNLGALDFVQFKTTLYKWAALNYPDSFLAYTFPVVTPTVVNNMYPCSDGKPRNIWDYIPFCLGNPLDAWLMTYQGQVAGIKLSFSINAEPYNINVHVSKV